MLNVCVLVQPAGEETVTVYEPAVRPVADAPVPPEGAHEYVYVPVPPVAVTDALPVAPPLHKTFVCVGVSVIAGGCVIVNDCVAVQPAGEETVHV
jgi:hypothetical protein